MAEASGKKVQLVSYVEDGLRRTVAERAAAEGLTPSTVVRRAVMFHLGVDSAGSPVSRATVEAPGAGSEIEALAAALAQNYDRRDVVLSRMDSGALRELSWAAEEVSVTARNILRARGEALR